MWCVVCVFQCAGPSTCVAEGRDGVVCVVVVAVTVVVDIIVRGNFASCFLFGLLACNVDVSLSVSLSFFLIFFVVHRMVSLRTLLCGIH